MQKTGSCKKGVQKRVLHCISKLDYIIYLNIQPDYEEERSGDPLLVRTKFSKDEINENTRHDDSTIISRNSKFGPYQLTYLTVRFAS